MATHTYAKSGVKSRAKSLTLRVVLLAALQAVSACVPLVVTATVAVVDIALDRRTAGKYWDDNVLEVKLRGDISQDEALGDGINVSVTALNGIVLLSGQVNNDTQRQRAEQLARKYIDSGEVSNVVNELALAGKTNLSSRLNDTWITGKVKARLLNVENLPTTAVKVVTEHGKVYLLGQVTQIEAEAAVEAARTVRGVTHIVKVFEYIE